MRKSLKNLVLLTLSSSLLIGAYVPTAVFAEAAEESTEEVVEESVEETEEAAEESEEATEEASEEETFEENVITKAELAEANGQDGNPAYVAVFGVVYDVTDNEAWPEGEHNGIQAGTDASEGFLASPHAMDLLADLPQVGDYADWELTTDLLAEFGPENENLRLVAVHGIVYDITEYDAWAEGEHNGVSAGTDATEAFEGQAPHDMAFLEELDAVGRHIDYVFTEETLAQYNGQDGNPAYVAVDGVVYDMTNIGAWEGGEHNGVSAGTDATEAFSGESPHEAELLETLPIAGQYQ